MCAINENVAAETPFPAPRDDPVKRRFSAQAPNRVCFLRHPTPGAGGVVVLWGRHRPEFKLGGRRVDWRLFAIGTRRWPFRNSEVVTKPSRGIIGEIRTKSAIRLLDSRTPLVTRRTLRLVGERPLMHGSRAHPHNLVQHEIRTTQPVISALQD